MKKAKFFRHSALALAVVCALTLAGCPTDPDPDPDPRLEGTWTNNAAGNLQYAGLVKTFTINPNFTFEADINPVFIKAYNETEGNDAAKAAAGNAALAALGKTEAGARWHVTGRLTADGGNRYNMSDLHETSDQPALQISGKADQEVFYFESPVRIIFTDDDNFKFESLASGRIKVGVDLFFGGDYTRDLPAE
jgi:hypothetical protein